MRERSVNLYWKWINLTELELKVILDVIPNKLVKEGIPKREGIPIKGKNDFKTFSSRRSLYRGLVETYQLLTNVNKLIESPTIPTDKIELNQTSKGLNITQGIQNY